MSSQVTSYANGQPGMETAGQDAGLYVDNRQWGKEAIAPSHGSPQYLMSYAVPDTEASKPPREPLICGMRRATFILSCLLAFVLAILVVIAGLFGAKLATVESTQTKFQSLLENSTNTAPTPTTNPAPGTNPGTPTGTAPAATSISIEGWTYMGCYTDNVNRVMPDAMQTTEALLNTGCASFCRGYQYFGTEFGDQCYCANAPSLQPAPAWNCINHCNGATSTSEVCGGFFYLSVWKRNS